MIIEEKNHETLFLVGGHLGGKHRGFERVYLVV